MKISKAKVLQLLRKGKEILSSQDKLVSDWKHLLEDSNGESLFAINGTLYDSDGMTNISFKHCKACIMGGVYLAYPQNHKYNDDTRSVATDYLHAANSELYTTNLATTHTLAQVQLIYDKAIKWVENASKIEWENKFGFYNR